MTRSILKVRVCRRAIQFILLAAITLSTNSFATMRKDFSGTQDEELGRVKDAANCFVKRFHETLDFGSAFNEGALPDAVKRLGRTKLGSLLDTSPELANEVDEAMLVRAYMAFMNFVYLRAVFNVSVNYDGSMDEDRVPLPSEILSALRASNQLRILTSDGVENAPFITTPQELRKYIDDLETIAALYKKHLPPGVFDSPTYKANVKTLEKEGGPSVEVDLGDDYFNVKETTKVYRVRKDIFKIYFIFENGTPKILGLGL